MSDSLRSLIARAGGLLTSEAFTLSMVGWVGTIRAASRRRWGHNPGKDVEVRLDRGSF